MKRTIITFVLVMLILPFNMEAKKKEKKEKKEDVCKYDYPKSFKSKYISRVSSSLSFSVKKRNLLRS